ncbi:hypothetical protein [Paenibacillus abyssi]|uniref:Uncharacterized protein n=1 Tax=Paenibacillus abyssi TaxID=1340531 RepID=A0A917LFD9_9BACL|nr:hypothetical protein [Paenibacillus abyssi]GGG18427.1 hypothetical protein GCM10010916_39070 [Paenibacillus abyssi]
MEKFETQLTWRNLLNTVEKSSQSVTIDFVFDTETTEEEVKLMIFNALSKYAQDLYLGPNLENLPKPTVFEVK